MKHEYKGYTLEQGYPSAFAMLCWIGTKTGCTTIYAKTLKEAKAKIDEIENNKQ